MTEREARTVMMVDGSATMLYYYGIVLKRLKYAVLAVDTPEHALKITDRTIPSLIITAISFPFMNGVDFIKMITCRERTKSIPIIVMTAEENESVRSACLNLGCVAYLIKPVDPVTLYRIIQTAVETTPRENIRISTSLRTIIGEGEAKNGAGRIEYTTAISEKGAYVRTLAPKAKDALIPIRLFIQDREIRATAVVLYTNAMERGAFREPGMGLKFIELSEDDRIYLRKFIHDQLISDIVIGPPEETGGFNLDLTK